MEEPLLNDTHTVPDDLDTVQKKTMTCCTPKCRKWTVFGLAVFFILIGIVLAVFTDDIVQSVKDRELNVGSDDTMEYKFWEVTPIPMFSAFYLFNWTNWEEVVASNWSVKPKFNQMGPYTYHEKHYRKNVTFNSNHTLTYQTQRIWHEAPDKTVGSFDDLITTVNPILVTLTNFVKYKHPIVKMGINFFLEEKRVNLTVTKTVREFIFDGYDDPMLDLVKKLHLRHLDIPFNKFAWFAERNGSITYDGVYNMYDGSDDFRKLGRLYQWNYATQTSFYAGNCGKISGTSGELWYPVADDGTVEVFSPDICSTLTLARNGTEEMFGLEGHKFVATAKALDNGTLYPDMACFSPGDVSPSGIRNVSDCKFGAPAFISYPHFYLADPYYRDAIDGMEPDPSEHQIVVTIEPETGIPLQAKVAAQINLHLDRMERIKLLEHVKPVLIPCMWFKQYANLDEKLASQAKLLIVLPSVGANTGYGVIALGCVLLLIFGFLTWKNMWGGRQESLLSQETF